MDENLSHDWISAYADGELSAEESARVEENLRQSPEAMRELFEIRALGGLIGEAVAVDVPPDFSARVMQQAEQESLIGKSPVDQIASQRRSRKLLPIVTICSTVACLAFILMLNGPGLGPNSPAPADLTVASNGTAVTPTGEITMADRSVSESVRDAERFLHEVPGSTEGEPLSGFGSGGFRRMSASVDGTDGVALRVISPINLRETSEIGDVVRALRMSANQVAIVELTVVDRQQGIDNLQFILSGSKIKQDSADRIDNPVARKGVEELYTVFVQAAPSQLHAVLEKMQKDMEFATVEVSTTISADTLEPFLASNGYASLNINRASNYYYDANSANAAKSSDASETYSKRGETPRPERPVDARESGEKKPIAADSPQFNSDAKAYKGDQDGLPEAPPLPVDDIPSSYAFSRQAVVRLPQKSTIDFIEQNRLQREVEELKDLRNSKLEDNLKKTPAPEPSAPATESKPVKDEFGKSIVLDEPPVQVLFVLKSEKSPIPVPASKPPGR